MPVGQGGQVEALELGRAGLLGDGLGEQLAVDVLHDQEGPAAPQLLPAQAHARTAAGALEAADGARQGGLADPVGAHDAGDGPGGEEQAGDVEDEPARALDLQVLDEQAVGAIPGGGREIGRASCRERV